MVHQSLKAATSTQKYVFITISQKPIHGKKDLEDLGAETILIKADLSNYKQTQNLIKKAYKKMRGLDCLINNASVFENDNLDNFSDNLFLKHLNINLKAPSILTQNFKKLIKNNEGCVINIIDQS